MPHFFSSTQINEIISSLPLADGEKQTNAAARQAQLTKPMGSLGRLEGVAIWMAGWQRRERPSIDHGQCIVFAGNHGVVKQGISPFPAEVTAQMVANFKAGGAAINQLCELADLKLDVIPLDLEQPTNDLSLGPAMTENEVIAAMNIGADALDAECDYLIVGLQSDPTIDRPDTKNKPIQTMFERYLQLKAVEYVDEVVPYQTEKDVIDILQTLPIDVRILGKEYKEKDFTGKDVCNQRGVELYFNTRDHRFSTTDLRKRVTNGD